MNYENLFLCRHTEEQEWDGGALVGILKWNLKSMKCAKKTGRRGRREDFDIGGQIRDCGLEEKFDPGPRR